MKLRYIVSTLALVFMIATPWLARAAVPVTENDVTTIHLDEYNGYFAARETLVDLKSGTYDFVVTNKAEKLVGFWLQDAKSEVFLDQFPLKPGEQRTTRVTLTENGFRYRCPINPTPWYEVGVSRR